MPRHLLNVATALSLLLCVAVAALGVRSLLYHDSFFRYSFDRPTWQYGEDEVIIKPGVVRYRWFRNEVFDESFARNYETQPAQLAWRHSQWPVNPPPARWGWLLPHYENQVSVGSGDRGVLSVPYLPVLLLSGILPGVWVRGFAHRRRAARRARAGRCPACGYDLRGTTHRCPECGTIPVRAPPRFAAAPEGGALQRDGGRAADGSSQG